MKIAHWNVEDAGELFRVYNEQTAAIPHCYPVSQEEFEAGLLCPRNDDHCRESHSEKIIVAEEDGEIVGFAHRAQTHNLDNLEKKYGMISIPLLS
jgi:hypothetical protein